MELLFVAAGAMAMTVLGIAITNHFVFRDLRHDRTPSKAAARSRKR